MEYRRLGTSGLQVSVAGLGCNNFGVRCDVDQTKAVVQAALDAGVTFFDTADIYGAGLSEQFLGEALGSHRDQVIIATKFGMSMGKGMYKSGASRHYINLAVEASLRRLGTDHIDLLQQHTPDPNTPIEETLEALADLVRQGKVRYLGSSNFTGWMIAEADLTAKVLSAPRYITAQNEWNALNRDCEREVIPACERFGISQLPYFPLASGMLTGKYKRGEEFPEGTRFASNAYFSRLATPRAFDQVEALTPIAAQAGISLGDLALSWLATQPVTGSVIAGARSPEQVKSNVAGTNPNLDAATMAAIEAALKDSD